MIQRGFLFLCIVSDLNQYTLHAIKFWIVVGSLGIFFEFSLYMCDIWLESLSDEREVDDDGE